MADHPAIQALHEAIDYRDEGLPLHSSHIQDRLDIVEAAVAELRPAVRIVEAGEVVSEIMMFDMGSGQDTPGCNCGHGGLGPGWHLSGCPWPAQAWAAKARELAKRMDGER
jgi:hypothetical protein